MWRPVMTRSLSKAQMSVRNAFAKIRGRCRVDGTDDAMYVALGVLLDMMRYSKPEPDILADVMEVGWGDVVEDKMQQFVVLLDMRVGRTLHAELFGVDGAVTRQTQEVCVETLMSMPSYFDVLPVYVQESVFWRYQSVTDKTGCACVLSVLLMENEAEFEFLPTGYGDDAFDRALEGCGTCEISRAVLILSVTVAAEDELEFRPLKRLRARLSEAQVVRRVRLVRDMLMWRRQPRARGLYWQFLYDFLGPAAWVDVGGALLNVGDEAVATSTYAFMRHHAGRLKTHWTRAGHARRAITHEPYSGALDADEDDEGLIEMAGRRLDAYASSTSATNVLFATLL